MHGHVGHELAEFTGQQVLAFAPGDAALRTRTGELWDRQTIIPRGLGAIRPTYQRSSQYMPI